MLLIFLRLKSVNHWCLPTSLFTVCKCNVGMKRFKSLLKELKHILRMFYCVKTGCKYNTHGRKSKNSTVHLVGQSLLCSRQDGGVNDVFCKKVPKIIHDLSWLEFTWNYFCATTPSNRQLLEQIYFLKQ